MAQEASRNIISRRNRPAKSPLSRDLIVATVLRILERDGLSGISLRRVAAALDTGAASLCEIFADGWDVESVELVRGEVSPTLTAEFPESFRRVVPKRGSRSSAANPESQHGTYSLE
jgi:hypothetical protein